MTVSGTTSDNEWYNVVQRVTTSGTTSDNKWKRVATSDSEWYNEWQRVTTNDSEWQPVTISANFFFQIRQEATTKHPKENSLNIEDPWRRPIELRAETNP